MTHALKITPDGVVTRVDLGADTLRGMYREIGCDSVEPVELTDQLDAWFDEEGMYRSTDQPNAAARQVVRAHQPHITQPFFGTALITGNDGHGGTVDVTAEQTATILALLAGVN